MHYHRPPASPHTHTHSRSRLISASTSISAGPHPLSWLLLPALCGLFTLVWLLAAAGSAAPSLPAPPTHEPHQQPAPQPAQLLFQVEEPARELDAKAHNRRALPDSAEPDVWKRRSQNVWRLFVLFQHNLPILVQAVEGFQRASDILVPNMIIIDNSRLKEAKAHPWLAQTVQEIVPTPTPLNFPQLHNFMATQALHRRLHFYLWAHADNYVMAMAPNRDMGKDVVDCLRQHAVDEPDWGMVLFSYDHLAAYRTQTMIQVPWDPHVFQYGSECDAYGRIRNADYAVKGCKVHLSFDMKRVLPIRASDSYDQIRAAMEEEAKDKRERNQWREGVMSTEEQAWRQRMKEASKLYLTQKWGEPKCKLRGVPCRQPWPYCTSCPEDLPRCLSKTGVSWEELDAIHNRVHAAFAADPNPPEPLTYR